MKRLCFVVCLLVIHTTILCIFVIAGEIVLKRAVVTDYLFVNNGIWGGSVAATSTVPWPHFNTYQSTLTLEDVVESGLMIYRCGDCSGEKLDLHRFVLVAPSTDGDIQVADRMLGNLYHRTWLIGRVQDAIQTIASFPLTESEFIDTSPDAVFPSGSVVTLHLADIDTISAMLQGEFGSPLAHRTLQPCTIKHTISDGTTSVIQCTK